MYSFQKGEIKKENTTTHNAPSDPTGVPVSLLSWMFCALCVVTTFCSKPPSSPDWKVGSQPLLVTPQSSLFSPEQLKANIRLLCLAFSTKLYTFTKNTSQM